MKYIKITNVAQEVNRLKLEKLGFSTKREDETTIGQFGSGIKFAPIAAIRKGIDFVFAGTDAKGEYTLRYVIKDEDGINSVFYQYEDYEKPSSFTAEAGSLSWETDFQIYREVIANAMDEAKISDTEWSVDIVDVDKIVPVEGEFSVYLLATEELLELHNNFDKYFSVNRTPLYERSRYSRIYESIDGTLRVYCKGVLVYSSEHRCKRTGGEPLLSFYDYEFDSLILNEERTISSEWDMNREICIMLAELEDEEEIEKLLNFFFEQQDEHQDYYETTSISSFMFASTKGVHWKKIFDIKYPKHVLVNKNFASINLVASIHSRGYDEILIDHDGIEKFLAQEGIPNFNTVFGEDFVYDYKMGFDSIENMNQAVNIITSFYPEFEDVKNFIGIVKGAEKEDHIYGMTLDIILNPGDEEKTRVIFIDDEYAESASLIHLIGTLVHEWDHFKTKIGDGDIEGRMFRNLADERIGQLIYEYWLLKEGK